MIYIGEIRDDSPSKNSFENNLWPPNLGQRVDFCVSLGSLPQINFMIQTRSSAVVYQLWVTSCDKSAVHHILELSILELL